MCGEIDQEGHDWSYYWRQTFQQRHHTTAEGKYVLLCRGRGNLSPWELRFFSSVPLNHLIIYKYRFTLDLIISQVRRQTWLLVLSDSEQLLPLPPLFPLETQWQTMLLRLVEVGESPTAAVHSNTECQCCRRSGDHSLSESTFWIYFCVSSGHEEQFSHQ